MKRVLALVLAMSLAALPASAERIKDIVNVQGVRSNPIWGYGLVIGLDGTGDNAAVSRRALASILRRSGIVLEPEDITSDNIASVLVTADLPPFARVGSTIDVTVSSIGNAESLLGGMLLMTPLMGADGEVYAVSQGSLTVGGFSATGNAASVNKNHVTVGRIPGGATVEREELADFIENGQISLNLLNPDVTTADAIAKAINAIYRRSAVAVDAGTVSVLLPPTTTPATLMGFLDKIMNLTVKVDQPALVVINERTGTIVVGQNVGISTVAISHGNLSIVTTEKDFISQPLPFSRTGRTQRIERTEIQAIEEDRSIHVVPKQVSVSELARALNAMGLTPRDLVAIFEALRRAGALQAELRIM